MTLSTWRSSSDNYAGILGGEMAIFFSIKILPLLGIRAVTGGEDAPLFVGETDRAASLPRPAFGDGSRAVRGPCYTIGTEDEMGHP